MLKISLLGPLQLLHNNQPLKFAALPKTLPLWAYLLLHAKTPLPRTTLAFTLWPDVDEAEARGNLRRHLYELRRVLPAAPAACPWLLADNQQVQWNPAAPYWLDVDHFTQACAEPSNWASAVQSYHGELLPGLDEEWIFFARETYHNRYCTTLRALIDRCRQDEEYRQAIGYSQQLLQSEPLREDIVRELMELRQLIGDRAGALQEYRTFEQRLRAELDVAPMVETSALYDAIARQLPIPDGAPVVASVPTFTAPPSSPAVEAHAPVFPHNLPAQLTSFIGREEELAQVRTLLTQRQDRVRLLTLTGPGGSGKTRLAVETATRLLNTAPPPFAQGIYVVFLANLTEAERVLPAIADVLGIKEQRNLPLLETLTSFLQEKALLLLLDNMEHLMAAVPQVATLLQGAAQLTILATSRTPLQLYGEHEFAVTALPIPDPDTVTRPDDLVRYAAANLFLTRSRAVNPRYTVQADQVQAIAAICARLNGLPLALELAAARSKLFAPHALLARLTDQLDFLADPRLPARQRTLRATLDWSYHLLTADEQRLLARLAIFAQHFSLEAAEAVCAIGGDLDVLNLLTALVNHSLVQQIEESESHSPRFLLLVAVHQYALAQLSAADAIQLHRQLVAYYAVVAQRAYEGLAGQTQMAWVHQLQTDEENLRAALGWALAGEGDATAAAQACQIVADLGRFWDIRGRLQEGSHWMAQAMARRHEAAGLIRVRLLNQYGAFLQMQGQLDEALTVHEEAYSLVRTLNEPRTEGITLHSLGLLAGRAGDLPRAERLLSDCLALYRRTPAITSADLSSLLNNLAIVTTRLGDFTRTKELLTESLALGRARGDKFNMANVLSNLGNLARQQADFVAARQYHAEALTLRQELNSPTGILATLQNLADLAFAQGDFPLALQLYAATAAIRPQYNTRLTGHMLTDFESNLAALQERLGTTTYQQLYTQGEQLTLEATTRLARTITP